MTSRTVRGNAAGRVQRNRGAILSLHRASEVVRRTVIENAKKDLILALVDCAEAVITSPELLETPQLRRHIHALRTLTSPSSSVGAKREILQTGGFLGALLGPLLGAIF